MNIYNETIYEFKSNLNYGLHDTEINDIDFDDTVLKLQFNSGVYFLNSEGKETELSGKCIWCFKIRDFNKASLFEHITLYKAYKNKFAEIDFKSFKKILCKNCFQIENCYSTPFNNSLLFKGYVGKFKIDFCISEIESIRILFL